MWDPVLHERNINLWYWRFRELRLVRRGMDGAVGGSAVNWSETERGVLRLLGLGVPVVRPHINSWTTVTVTLRDLRRMTDRIVGNESGRRLQRAAHNGFKSCQDEYGACNWMQGEVHFWQSSMALPPDFSYCYNTIYISISLNQQWSTWQFVD